LEEKLLTAILELLAFVALNTALSIGAFYYSTSENAPIINAKATITQAINSEVILKYYANFVNQSANNYFHFIILVWIIIQQLELLRLRRIRNNNNIAI